MQKSSRKHFLSIFHWKIGSLLDQNQVARWIILESSEEEKKENTVVIIVENHLHGELQAKLI